MTPINHHLRTSALATLLILFTCSLVALAGEKSNAYQQTNLVSDQADVAKHQDGNLVNAWGLVFNPNGPAWVADNGTSVSTLYDGNGTPFPEGKPLVVTIPGQNPTGIVFFGGSGEFLVDGNASRFIFATENGTIDAWAPPPTGPLPTVAVTVVNNSGADSPPVYKGLAIGGNGEKHFLYATDFSNAKIDVFNTDFKPATLKCEKGLTFSDPKIPEGFAPFGIQNLLGNLYVTYAKQDEAKHDDVAGPGNGFVNVFDPNGCLIRRVASGGTLNSPWGLAIAPDGFGKFSDNLLVGNFGDGRITAFDIDNGGKSRGQLHRPNGEDLVIDGLWALVFGNGVQHQPINVLFFTAGPDDENHGLYGKIEALPTGKDDHERSKNNR